MDKEGWKLRKNNCLNGLETKRVKNNFIACKKYLDDFVVKVVKK